MTAVAVYAVGGLALGIFLVVGGLAISIGYAYGGLALSLNEVNNRFFGFN